MAAPHFQRKQAGQRSKHTRQRWERVFYRYRIKDEPARLLGDELDLDHSNVVRKCQSMEEKEPNIAERLRLMEESDPGVLERLAIASETPQELPAYGRTA